MWYEGKSNDDRFPASFRLLSIRGDAFGNIETASTVASVSDVLVMFCDKDMFQIDSFKNLLQTISRKLIVQKREEKMIKELVVVFTKNLYKNVKINRSLFQSISKEVIWEMVSNNYQTFLASIDNTVQKSLTYTHMDTISTLNERFEKEDKESNMENTGMSKDVNDLLLETVSMIKKSN